MFRTKRWVSINGQFIENSSVSLKIAAESQPPSQTANNLHVRSKANFLALARFSHSAVAFLATTLQNLCAKIAITIQRDSDRFFQFSICIHVC